MGQGSEQPAVRSPGRSAQNVVRQSIFDAFLTESMR